MPRPLCGPARRERADTRRAVYNQSSMRRVFAIAGAEAIVALGVAAGARAPAPGRHAQLATVVDGLRPDYIAESVMPRLTRLGRRGIVFTAHHSVFPTVTRVNASSIATGTYPETHGLLGNTIFVPSVNPTRGLDTGNRENLEAVARAEPQLLPAPSLGQVLQASGRKVLAVGSGTSGSTFLLNHTVAGGAIVHNEFVRPAAIEEQVVRAIGPTPAHATPNAAQNRRAVDAYLKWGLDAVHPD